MMQVLAPTYTLSVVIRDGNVLPLGGGFAGQINVGIMGQPIGVNNAHEFYQPLTGKTGCDEVLAAVKEALSKAGLAGVLVTLEKFEHS